MKLKMAGETSDAVGLPSELMQGIIERADRARAELAEILQVPALWPCIIGTVRRERNQNVKLKEAAQAALLAIDQATFTELDASGDRAKRLLREALNSRDEKLR